MTMNWIGLIIGAAIGYLLGYIFRCQGNSCPIYNTWWITTGIGALLGLTWNMGKKPDDRDLSVVPGKNPDHPENNHNDN